MAIHTPKNWGSWKMGIIFGLVAVGAALYVYSQLRWKAKSGSQLLENQIKLQNGICAIVVVVSCYILIIAVYNDMINIDSAIHEVQSMANENAEVYVQTIAMISGKATNSGNIRVKKTSGDYVVMEWADSNTQIPPMDYIGSMHLIIEFMLITCIAMVFIMYNCRSMWRHILYINTVALLIITIYIIRLIFNQNS